MPSVEQGPVGCLMGKVESPNSRLRSRLPEVLRFDKFNLLTLLSLGLGLRLAFAPFTSHPYDLAVLYRATNDLFAGLNLYTTNSFSYPPLWAYIEYPAFRLVSFISPKLLGVQLNYLDLSIENWKLPPVITSPLFNFLCKLPLIIADLLIALIIHDTVKELRDEKQARLSFILWFLNPIVIYIDSIHGQFDVLPALMTVLSFCLFCKRRYFGSGIALGLGALFKIYPVFLVPLYLCCTVRLEKDGSKSYSEKVKGALVNSSKLVVGVLFSFFVFLVPMINSNIVHDIFTRTAVASLGGFTFFNVVHFPGLQGLLPLISGTGLVSTGLTILLLVLILAISFASFFSRKDFLETFVLGHIAILLVIYLTSLVVNPQYILWLLPFLILSYGFYRYNLKSIIVISICAVVFLIGLSGPLFYLYPAALFTPLRGIELIYANMYFFKNVGGWIIILISGVVGVISLLLCLTGAMASLLRGGKRSTLPNQFREDKQSSNVMMGAKGRRHVVRPFEALVVVLVFLMIGQFLALTQPLTQQDVRFNAEYLQNQPTKIILGYSIKTASYPVDLQVSAIPVTPSMNRSMDKSVFIYYDEAYPSSPAGRARWIGLIDHAPVELKLRGYSGYISIINADQLKSVMEQPNDSIIIMPSGVFPETVHAKNESIVGKWLHGGGTLIWMGDAFAYLSGCKDGNVTFFTEGENYSQVQNQILGFTLFSDSTNNPRFATIPSNFSNALDLQYPDAFVGAQISEVAKSGGVVLGKATDSKDARTSICYVPVGSGHLLLFGGEIGQVFTTTGEDVIAHDIAQILSSGFPFSSRLCNSSSLELEKNETVRSSLDIPLPQDQNITGIMVAVFSKSPYSRYFMRQFYPINYTQVLLGEPIKSY